jgi:hypothetical protein
MVLPAELAPEGQASRRLADVVLNAVSEEDRDRLEACGVYAGEADLLHIVRSGAAQQLGSSMKTAAVQARRWMKQLLREALGEAVGESILNRILRSKAHVRLEEGVVRVRLLGLRRARDRRIAEALCSSLNTFDPRMVPPYELPVQLKQGTD